MDTQKKSPRISNMVGALMIAVALFLDLVSLIPFVNIIVDVVAVLVFGLWFYAKKLGFVNPRTFVAPFLGIIVEAIPALSVLPGITLAVIVTIAISRAEDKTGVPISLLAGNTPGKKSAGKSLPNNSSAQSSISNVNPKIIEARQEAKKWRPGSVLHGHVNDPKEILKMREENKSHPGYSVRSGADPEVAKEFEKKIPGTISGHKDNPGSMDRFKKRIGYSDEQLKQEALTEKNAREEQKKTGDKAAGKSQEQTKKEIEDYNKEETGIKKEFDEL